jgi:hypothetical protein
VASFKPSHTLKYRTRNTQVYYIHNFTYVYIYIYIYIHICVLYIYTYTYKYTYIYIYVYIRLHIYVYGPRQGSYMTKLGVLTHRKKERKKLRLPSDYIYIYIYILIYIYMVDAPITPLPVLTNWTMRSITQKCSVEIAFYRSDLDMIFSVALTDFD